MLLLLVLECHTLTTTRRIRTATGVNNAVITDTDEHKQDNTPPTTSEGTTSKRKESQQQSMYIGISIGGAATIFIIIIAAVNKNGWVNMRRGAMINIEAMEMTN